MDIVFDMETQDPDDVLTLLYLLRHPRANLKAVTITPGTKSQVGLVLSILATYGRSDIPVGSFDPEYGREKGKPMKTCVSSMYHRVFTQWDGSERDPDALGHVVLREMLKPDTTLVTGAPLKNLGALLRTDLPEKFRFKWVCQGGFAGVGVVDPEKALEKFKGLQMVPTFNLGGDIPSAELAFSKAGSVISEVKMVSKNVCHGVFFDRHMLSQHTLHLCASHKICTCPCHRNFNIDHFMACCSPCTDCGRSVTVSDIPDPLQKIASWMTDYLKRKPAGKKLHDPLAAMCALTPEIGTWARVRPVRVQGKWGSVLDSESPIQIITDYDPRLFVQTLLET